MNPVTTIHPARIYDKPSWLPTSSPACKPPKQRIFQQDELSLYKGSSTVKSFEEIGESLLQFLDSDYKCFLHDKHYYKTVFDELSIPQITECTDSDLHDKLFYYTSSRLVYKNFGM